jgi:predicted HTH domain antitoxin
MQDLVISAEMLQQLQMSPAELRVDLAVYLYDKERMTMGQAKKLAGLTQIQFQRELARRNVFIKYDVEDFEQDLRTLDELDQPAGDQ